MKEKFSMKDAAFNRDNISDLADRIKKSLPSFNKKAFLQEILNSLFDLELKERSALITQKLIQFLPDDYEEALAIILKSLPLENGENEVSGYDGFIIMPLTGFVSQQGLENFEISTKALYEMTKRFTSEFDIRFFIQRYPKEMMQLLYTWAKDDNVHVRRLVSEGTRSRLPWAFQLKCFIENPDELFPLLTALKDDKELYVRRSVANNLNDISKDHPQKVINLLKTWQEKSKNIEWITKHALRTLIKKGDKSALEFLGFLSTVELDVDIVINNYEIYMGKSLAFEVIVKSLSIKDQPLIIDYIVWYRKSNGSLSPKVFKLKQLTLQSKKSVTFNKSHKFSNLSTRKHYEGEHQLGIQINGKVYKKVTFKLLCK